MCISKPLSFSVVFASVVAVDVSIQPLFSSERCPEVPLVRDSHAVWEGINEPGASVLIICNPGHRFSDGQSEKWMMCQHDMDWEDIGYCKSNYIVKTNHRWI